MNDSTTVRTGTMRTGTMYTGPLGSTIHVLRADAGTIAELAAIDWNRYFRRVCLDPVRGLITLMAPSHPHENLATILDDIVDAAGSVRAGARKGLLREEEAPYPVPPARSGNGDSRLTVENTDDMPYPESRVSSTSR